MMFPEDLRCHACDAPRPVDGKQLKLEAFVKQNPDMAHLLNSGSGKATGKGGPKGKGDKGKGKGGKDIAQSKDNGKGKGGKSEPAGKGKGNGKGDKGGKHTRGPQTPLKDAEVLDAHNYAGSNPKATDEEHCVVCDGCGKIHNTKKFVLGHWCSNRKNKEMLCQGVMVAVETDGQNAEGDMDMEASDATAQSDLPVPRQPPKKDAAYSPTKGSTPFQLARSSLLKKRRKKPRRKNKTDVRSSCKSWNNQRTVRSLRRCSRKS